MKISKSRSSGIKTVAPAIAKATSAVGKKMGNALTVSAVGGNSKRDGREDDAPAQKELFKFLNKNEQRRFMRLGHREQEKYLKEIREALHGTGTVNAGTETGQFFVKAKYRQSAGTLSHNAHGGVTTSDAKETCIHHPFPEKIPEPSPARIPYAGGERGSGQPADDFLKNARHSKNNDRLKTDQRNTAAKDTSVHGRSIAGMPAADRELKHPAGLKDTASGIPTPASAINTGTSALEARVPGENIQSMPADNIRLMAPEGAGDTASGVTASSGTYGRAKAAGTAGKYVRPSYAASQIAAGTAVSSGAQGAAGSMAKAAASGAVPQAAATKAAAKAAAQFKDALVQEVYEKNKTAARLYEAGQDLRNKSEQSEGLQQIAYGAAGLVSMAAASMVMTLTSVVVGIVSSLLSFLVPVAALLAVFMLIITVITVAVPEIEAEENQSYLVGDNTIFIWPLPGHCRKITSPYGWRHCPFHGEEFHPGMDISASMGTSIYASKGGRVVTATSHYSLGNYIVIDHGDGTMTQYNHASELLVSSGQAVNQGDVIAKVGSTGSSTGPHLDFRIYVNGQTVNPLDYASPDVNVDNMPKGYVPSNVPEAYFDAGVLPSWMSYEMVLSSMMARESYGYPVSALLGQMYWENGPKGSLLGSKYHNYAGIKYYKGMNKTYAGLIIGPTPPLKTYEYINGVKTSVYAEFSVFASDGAYLEYRAKYLLRQKNYTSVPNYQKAVKNNDPWLFLVALGQGGYHTGDPYKYADNVMYVARNMYPLMSELDSMSLDTFKKTFAVENGKVVRKK